MYGWDTIEGGPCVLRPTGATSSDSPNPDKMAYKKCFKRQSSRDKCVLTQHLHLAVIMHGVMRTWWNMELTWPVH